MRLWQPRIALLLAPLAACSGAASGDWVNDGTDAPPASLDVQPLTSARPAGPAAEEAAGPPAVDAGADEPVLIKEHGRPGAAPAPVKKPKGGGGVSHPAPAEPSPDGGRAPQGARPDSPQDPNAVFRNTYYDFPREGPGEKALTLYDARCSPIAPVTRQFHDDVCVQGSGRIASGATVSFAKRDCECASNCPRTGQRICFDKLDPARFPHGRGASGTAITPLRTVAVDSAVIPLGTVIFVPELVGLPMPDGTRHDGCFIAEDRGIKVMGRQIDVFTGDPTLTARYNTIFPSNRGVHVRQNDPRCRPMASRS
jgi:3D (Asp-Asp-Asp) domain-containing protein